MRDLVSVQALDGIRNALYGREARLIFYGLSPVDGEIPLFTLLNGWHAAREKRDRMDGRNMRVTIWINRDARPENFGDDWVNKLNMATKIDIQVNEFRVQSYRIVEVRTLSQVHSGWIFTTEPTENAVKKRL